MPEGHLQSPSSNRPRRLCKNMILHLEAVYLHAEDDQLQVSQSSHQGHQGPRPHTPESACGGAVQPKSDLSRLCRFLCAFLTQQNFKKRTWTNDIARLVDLLSFETKIIWIGMKHWPQFWHQMVHTKTHVWHCLTYLHDIHSVPEKWRRDLRSSWERGSARGSKASEAPQRATRWCNKSLTARWFLEQDSPMNCDTPQDIFRLVYRMGPPR